MASMENRPQEINEAGDAPGEAGNQALLDATFQPETHLELVEDFKRAENIQNNLHTMITATITPEAQVTDGEQPGDMPTPLPEPAAEAGLKFNTIQPSGIEETPLPGIAGEMGYQSEPESLPEPIPGHGTAEEVGFKYEGTQPSIVEETDLPGPGEEAAWKFHVQEPASIEETPLPGRGGNLGIAETGRDFLTGVEPAAIKRILTNTEAGLQEMNLSFNLQSLQFEKRMQAENRQVR